MLMLVIDLAWLLFGARLEPSVVASTIERALNLCLAAMILGSARLAFL